MDSGLSLIRSILSDHSGFSIAKRDGIDSSLLVGKGAEAWDFISNYFIEYGSIPTEDLFFSKTGINLPAVIDPLKAIVDDIRDHHLWKRATAAHDVIGTLLTNRDVRGAVDKFQSFIKEIYSENLYSRKVGSLLALGPEVLAMYNRIKNGERGVLTPWPEMNEMTLGWWPGDFVVFVGRMGTGKSFILLQLLLQAWNDGKKALFIGTEMNRINLATRFFAIHNNIPYDSIKKGRLTTLLETKLKESIESISSEKGISIAGDDFNADINEILEAIEQTHPDVVFVDGLYLVKNKGHDRHTIVSNNADDLKRASKRLGIPIITSTQFNREVSANSKQTISAEKIGISDVIGWNADVIFGLYRTDDMIEDKIMGIRPLKLREGFGNDFFINWNFETMDFSQNATSDEVGGKYSEDVVSVESGGDTNWGDGGVLF